MNNPLDDRLSFQTPQLWDRPPPLQVVPGLAAAPPSADQEEKDQTAHQPQRDGSALVLLLSLPQAGKALGIGRSKLYELIADGELETVHIGRAVRIPVEAIDAFVKNLRRMPSGRREV